MAAWDFSLHHGQKLAIGLTFGRDTSANLNVWLFDNHALLDVLSASTTIFGCQHPFAISIGEAINRDDANAGLVVAAVARSEAYAPAGLEKKSAFVEFGFSSKRWVLMTYSELHVRRLEALHALLCAHGILASEHLDESMALLDIDDARLD